MNVKIIENRKSNILYLIVKYGSQSKLGRALKSHVFSQATISEIVRPNGNRKLSYKEARKIEGVLVIPEYWMDKKDWISSGWNLIEKYRNLDESGRKLFNETISFVEERFKN